MARGQARRDRRESRSAIGGPEKMVRGQAQRDRRKKARARSKAGRSAAGAGCSRCAKRDAQEKAVAHLKSILVGVHQLGALMSAIEEGAIDEGEAENLARAILDVAKQRKLKPNKDLLAWGNFATVLLTV